MTNAAESGKSRKGGPRSTCRRVGRQPSVTRNQFVCGQRLQSTRPSLHQSGEGENVLCHCFSTVADPHGIIAREQAVACAGLSARPSSADRTASFDVHTAFFDAHTAFSAARMAYRSSSTTKDRRSSRTVRAGNRFRRTPRSHRRSAP